jgi:hypothetical protein
MKLNRYRHLAQTSAFCLAVIASSHAGAATPPDDHAAHHPAAAASQPAVDAGKYSAQMARMQEMHQKMQAAKTPEERAALMKEHLQVMQGGMAMMGQMPGCMAMHCRGMGTPPNRPKGAQKTMPRDGMRAEHEAMHQRMDMMEMMMRMMLDRQGVTSGG